MTPFSQSLNSLPKLLPGDRYVVHRNEMLSIAQLSFLIHFYQPIIGSSAVSLYLTLLNDIPIDQVGRSKPETHRWLLAASQLPLSQWLDARYRLEAIGLLETWQHVDEQKEDAVYHYRLLSPLNPASFFQSEVLSAMLYNRVGKFKFKQMLQRYITDTGESERPEEVGQNITKGFHDVFQLSTQSEWSAIPETEQQEALMASELATGLQGTLTQGDKGAIVFPQMLDVKLLKSLISSVFKPHMTLRPETIPFLNELAYLYGLNEMQLAHFIENPQVYNEDGELVLSELGLVAKEWYRKSHFGKLPEWRVTQEDRSEQNAAASYSTQRASSSELTGGQGLTDTEAEHVKLLETLSPLALLEMYQDGGKIPDADIDLIDALTMQYRLPMPVINVLVEYVLFTRQFKLPRTLVEKIAGHWKRLKLTRASEALEIAKKEHRVYKDWAARANASGGSVGNGGETPGQSVKGGSRAIGGAGGFKGTSGVSGAGSKRKSGPTATRDKLPSWIERQLEQEADGGNGDSTNDQPDKEKRAIELLRALGEVE